MYDTKVKRSPNTNDNENDKTMMNNDKIMTMIMTK